MATLRSTLQSLRRACLSSLDLERYASAGLTNEAKRRLPPDVEVYHGKVRDVVLSPTELTIHHSDRLTAFDRLIGHVPYKGFILCTLTEWWFTAASRAGLSHHFLRRIGPSVIQTKRLAPIRAEVVVRRYLAGSLLRAYEKGERVFCGVRFANGLRAFEKLPEIIITPTTKAAAFEHDENASPEQLISQGVCSRSEWEIIERLARQTFEWGWELAAQRGWILADTKYEFGKDPSGQIILMDEIHTPDSSRFWVTASYSSHVKAGQPPEMFDKENVRRHLISLGFQGYGPVPTLEAGVLLDLAERYLAFAESLMGREIETP